MSSSSIALLVIDPRDELRDPSAGARRHRDARELAVTIDWVARVARQRGMAVAHLGAGDATLTGALAAAGAPETVDALLLAGVGTDAGVLAAAHEARRRGYAVTVLADATTEATAGRHEAALREAAALGAVVASWTEAFGAEGFALTGLGAGGASLACGALGACIDEGSFAALSDEVTWSAMRHRGGEVPRLVALQGERGEDGVEPLYRHPADEQPPLRAWTPTVDRIRRAVEARVGHPLNHALLQLYRSGRDWISEHADKTLDLVRPSSIVNVSLGDRRTMLLRPKQKERGDLVQRVPLPHGSMFVLDLESNRRFLHAIKQEGGREGARISLTLRHIGTWWSPSSGAVWGVGATTDDRAEAERIARARAARSPAERDRADRAEAERMLQLFRAENTDPDFDAAAYRPGFALRDLDCLQE